MKYITRLQEELRAEKEGSAFLEKLLKTLYGDGWEKLTLYDAKKWHDHHLSEQSSRLEILAAEIHAQVHNGASVSDIMQLLSIANR